MAKTDSRTADVNVDSLKFDAPTAAALVRCYRCWLGCGGGEVDELLEGIPTTRLRPGDVTEVVERLWDEGEPRTRIRRGMAR